MACFLKYVVAHSNCKGCIPCCWWLQCRGMCSGKHCVIISAFVSLS